MAYGHVPAPKKEAPLKARVYERPARCRSPNASKLLAWPIDCTKETISPALASVLSKAFNDELALGITYPQRGPMSMEEFASYFLSYDLVVGLLLSDKQIDQLLRTTAAEDNLDSTITNGRQVIVPSGSFDGFEGKDWDQAVAFCYYIKPNYPGRSSHLCNAGFLVPATKRGLGLGGIAALSFLAFGPMCGYMGSVFNLVYANNEASVRIWERLGFYRVGRIPKAGLLKRKDGNGEEYVDAWVIHGDFEKLGLEGVKPS